MFDFLAGPVYKGKPSDHFDGEKFFNPGMDKENGLKDVLKWMMNRDRGKWERKNNLPGEKPNPRVEGSSLVITFVNHSTFLIQTEGLNILTDPVWSERVSPFKNAGPKRMVNPGLNMNDLPPIDIILLSHNHYDHLDIDTMKELCRNFHPLILTPLGVGKFLMEHHISKWRDFDWWESFAVNEDVKISAVPAQHFSGRGFKDRNKTLWCGYVITTTYGNIYFAGDSGYGSFFKSIGDRFQPITASIIPIGAYLPRWFMSPIHCSPDEAVKIHVDIHSEKSIASHFGTFPLADDGMDEPKIDLKKSLALNYIPEDKFIVPVEGKAIKIR